jgi:DNA mismatch endonuclease (patch repair protein)
MTGPVEPARSALMARIRGKDSAPERVVRSLAHALGYRFRLHRRDLPGTPDLVFPGRRRVVFVHGCFWHRHPGCSRTTAPRTRADFWADKFARNVARDADALQALEKRGWAALVIWECETADRGAVTERLRAFLGDRPGANDLAASIVASPRQRGVRGNVGAKPSAASV